MAIYQKMINYQQELIKLTTLTEQIVQNIGIAFSDTENESIRESIQTR